METVKSITEAFSQQPAQLFTSTQEQYDNYKNDNYRKQLIKEIKLETIRIGTKCGDPVEEIYYVGYNFEGKKIFQYIANTVNVQFQP